MLSQYLEHFSDTVEEVMGESTCMFHLNLRLDTAFKNSYLVT